MTDTLKQVSLAGDRIAILIAHRLSGESVSRRRRELWRRGDVGWERHLRWRTKVGDKCEWRMQRLRCVVSYRTR